MADAGGGSSSPGAPAPTRWVLSMWWIQPTGNCRPARAAGTAGQSGDRLASIAAGRDASVGHPGTQMGTVEDGMKGGVRRNGSGRVGRGP